MPSDEPSVDVRLNPKHAILSLCGFVLLVIVLQPLDGDISRWARGLPIGGDLRRELSALQQFGQGSVSALGALMIALAVPTRSRRLLDWGAAALVTGVIVQSMKMLLGRPRPKFDDPMTMLGPFNTYPIDENVGERHAWEIGSGISSDLWSMPSSHTAYAVVMAVFVSAMFPRLRGLMIAMAVLVGVCRVLFGAHYPTDVLVGAGVAWVISRWAIDGYVGVRSLDAFWKRRVDRDASPQFAAVYARERAATGR